MRQYEGFFLLENAKYCFTHSFAVLKLVEDCLLSDIKKGCCICRYVSAVFLKFYILTQTDSPMEGGATSSVYTKLPKKVMQEMKEVWDS